MARILLSLMLIASLTTAVNAANVFYTLADDTAVTEVVLLAGESVDLKVKVDATGETFNSADLWLIEANNSGLSVAGAIGTWAGFGSFIGDALSGFAFVPQTGVVQLGTFTLTSAAAGDGLLGIAGASVVGNNGAPLSLSGACQ